MTHDEEVALATRLLVGLGFFAAALGMAAFVAWPVQVTAFLEITAMLTTFLAAFTGVCWAFEVLAEDRRRKLQK